MGILLRNKKELKYGLSESDFSGLKKYKEINILLKKFPLNGKFFSEKEIVKNAIKNTLNGNIDLTEKDWDILTILKLFDEATFNHSLGVFNIIKDKLNKNLILKRQIEKDLFILGYNLGIFYRACLFHDIGKILIPKIVLKNSLNDREWALRLYRALRKRKNIFCFSTKKYLKKYGIFHLADKIAHADSPDKILEILTSNKLRPTQIISLKYGISRKELSRISREYNIDGDLSLGDIMAIHEKESYIILKKLSYPGEAMIAGGHGLNNYSDKFREENFIDILNIIYLADIQEALSSDRYYHKALPLSDVLEILISKIKEKNIEKKLSHFWIKDEFEKVNKGNNSKTINKIKIFLNEYK